jgi:glycosyltransferase involved in cell wall biosynthesis
VDAPLIGAHGRRPARVAVVPWGTPLEVFLDPLGRTLDDFCERWSGGWLFGYAEALRLAGYDPTLVVSSRTVVREASRCHAATGTPVTVLPAPSREPSDVAGVRGDLSAYRSALAPGLLGVLSRHDVVLLQEYEEPRTDLLAWWGRVRGTPVYASFQGGAPPWSSAPVQSAVRGPSVRRLAGLLVGSAEEQDRVVRTYLLPPERVHRVVNPVDVTAWAPRSRSEARARLGLPSDAFVVAWHGRVDLRRKGLDVLVTAWRDLCESAPDADLRLLLVGAGQDDAALRSLLEAPGLRGVLWLAEYAAPEQVCERLAACDLWVSASRHEGFAVAPLEAMSSGRAVLLSDAPGIAELVGTPGSSGAGVVPRGSAQALASALHEALLARPQLDLRGRAARRRVEQLCSVAAVGRQLAAALSAVPARGRA